MLYMSTTMDPSNPAHSTQPNANYEDQFVWDDNKQEPTKDLLEDTDMEPANEAGEKQKAT
eukprot:2831542-Ditylum_brightwellii.AAC.1